MRGPGLIGLVQLAVVIAFALPLAGFGITLLLDGRRVGFVFLGLAAAMIVVHQVLTNPFAPDDVVESVTDRVLPDDER